MKARDCLFVPFPEKTPPLSASQMPLIARKYERKYKIKIYVNGESEFGKAILDRRDAYNAEVSRRLKDEKLKYAAYLSAFWCHEEILFRISNSSFDLMTRYKLFQAMEPYKADGKMRHDLNENELQAFALALEAIPNLKQEIDVNLDECETKVSFHHWWKDLGLSEDETEQEILSIRQSLQPGERVGYVWTNGHRLDAEHFEVLIITATNIYRPADWRMSLERVSIDADFNGDFVDADLTEFMLPAITWLSPDYRGKAKVKKPRAQSSGTECGALGMLYLKELLKNEAQQLRDYSLTIPYINRFGSLEYLFLPSPQVLRYSQSTVYNNIVKSMIENVTCEPAIVKNHKPLIHKEYTVNSIVQILQTMLAQSSDEKLKQECERLLNLLPDFRKKWLAQYHISMQRRDTMHDGEVNRYLSAMATLE